MKRKPGDIMPEARRLLREVQEFGKSGGDDDGGTYRLGSGTEIIPSSYEWLLDECGRLLIEHRAALRLKERAADKLASELEGEAKRLGKAKAKPKATKR